LIDGREDDFVFSYVNDNSASGKIGDDFVSAITVLGRRDF
jgi:hypothetical protein